jgi:hypothetical protein
MGFTLKSILSQKEELWKFKYFTMQKYNLQKKSCKRNHSPPQLVPFMCKWNCNWNWNRSNLVFRTWNWWFSVGSTFLVLPLNPHLKALLYKSLVSIPQCAGTGVVGGQNWWVRERERERESGLASGATYTKPTWWTIPQQIGKPCAS